MNSMPKCASTSNNPFSIRVKLLRVDQTNADGSVVIGEDHRPVQALETFRPTKPSPVSARECSHPHKPGFSSMQKVRLVQESPDIR